MKKFKFKLEGLLKVRKFAEEKCRTELGHLQVLLTDKKNEIENEKINLNICFDSQEKMLVKGIRGKEIEFFPMFIEGKREKIEQLKMEQQDIEEAIIDKRNELAQKRADVKLIEKLKEKDFEQYKKEYNKQQNKKIEEQVQLWLQYKE